MLVDKMLKYKTQTIEVEEVAEVICNYCEKTCKENEYATLQATWGFLSRKDYQAHESHICEDCYDKIVRSFVVAPMVRHLSYVEAINETGIFSRRFQKSKREKASEAKKHYGKPKSSNTTRQG